MTAASGIRAGRAFVELFVEDSRLFRGLRQAQRKLQAFGASVRSMGLQFAALGAGIAAPLALATRTFISSGDQLDKMAARTGVSVEALSELGYAAKLSGASLADVEASVRLMQRTIGEAATSSATAVDAFTHLGLSIADLQGLNPEAQFLAVARALQALPDPTDRAASAMEVFGRSGTKLLPLLGNLDELRTEARRLGITFRTAEASAAAALGDSFDRVRMAVTAVAKEVGVTLAPILQRLAERTLEAVAGFRAWIAENRGLVTALAGIAVLAGAIGAGLIAVGLAASGLGVVFGGLATVVAAFGATLGGLGTALAALTSPIGLVIAGTTLLGATIATETRSGSAALAWLGEGFSILRDDAVAAWGGMADALAAGNLSLAAEVAWAGLTLAWRRGTAALTDLWQSAVTGFAIVFAEVWYGIEATFAAVVDALAEAWARLVGGMTDLWQTAVEGIATGLASLGESLGVVAEGTTQAIRQETDDRTAQARQATEERARQRAADLTGRRQRQEAIVGGLREDLAADVGARQAQVTEARDAFLLSLDRARSAKAEAETRRTGRPSEARGTELPDLDRLAATLDRVPEALAAASEKLDITGAFSAVAVGRLGVGDSAADRTAKASEQTATNTTRLVRLLEDGGLEFG